MYTYVMKFGVKRILENRELAEEHSRLAHDLYNELLGISLNARKRYREIRQKYVPGYDEAQERLDELKAQIGELSDAVKAKRQSATAAKIKPGRDKTKKVRGVRVVDDNDEQAQLKRLKKEREVIAARVKELREVFRSMTEPADKEYDRRRKEGPGRGTKQSEMNERIRREMLEGDWPEFWKEIARVEMDAVKRKKAVYAEACHPGPKEWARLSRSEGALHFTTYNAVADDVMRAMKMAKKRDPSYRKWVAFRCGKKVGVEVKGPQWLQIVDRQPFKRGTGNRSRHERAVVRIRIGSHGREPIWVSCLVTFHRPIPDDAKITHAFLVPRRIGERTEYTVQFTVKMPRKLRERAPGNGTAYVELKWSNVDKRTFVCATVNGGEVLLPDKIRSGLDLADSLRTISDSIFNGARDFVKSELKSGRAPEWTVEECKHMHTWRAHGKFLAVADRWSGERLGDRRFQLWRAWRDHRLADGRDLYSNPPVVAEWCSENASDVDPFALWLLIWSQKERHLKDWEAGQRAKTLAHRKDFYRTLAAQLSTQYERCDLKKVDLKNIQRLPDVDEEANGLEKIGRSYKAKVAPYELKQALKDAFGERFSEVSDPGGARQAKKQQEGVAESVAAE